MNKKYVHDYQLVKYFLTIFFGGLIIHLFCLTNVLHNYDDIAVLPAGYGTGVTSGRWFLTILGDFIDKLWGNFNLPLFNGVIFIFLISLTNIFLIDFFKIQSKKFGILFQCH